MGFNKTLGQALLILLLAIGSYGLLHENDRPSAKQYNKEQDQSEKPSAFIKGGRFKIYDKSGQATLLSSKEALYFTDPKRVLIQSPAISFDTNSGQTITLIAKEGTLYPDNEQLSLKGNVVIQQLTTNSPQQNDENWTLKSEEFKLNNKTHFISTDQAVTMTKGSSLIRAVGLKAWIYEKRIELLSDVRGRYVFN